MSNPIVVRCPNCSCKYRLTEDKIGLKARCRRCQQRFTIAHDQPIDEDTIFGWVVEDADPSSQSVLGGTGIMDSPVQAELSNGPIAAASSVRTPKQPTGVSLLRINEQGAGFGFLAEELASTRLRSAFPKQCISCGMTRHLNVHLLVWEDKLPRDEAMMAKDRLNHSIGRLQNLAGFDHADWIEEITVAARVPPPFHLPFPFYVCSDCDVEDEIAGSVYSLEDREYCELLIANMEIAAKFYRNNGKPDADAYARLARHAERQRKDAWQSLSSTSRRQINQWLQLENDEAFVAYYPAVGTQRREMGLEGLVLTNRRIACRKNASFREYSLSESGKLLLQPNPDSRTTGLRFAQKGRREAQLEIEADFADQLIRQMQDNAKPWKVTGQVRPF